MSPVQGEVTRLLKAWSEGVPQALAELMPLVVEELRGIARRQFAREAPGHTLQPTALVNETYLELARRRSVQWANRRQFFAFAGEVMRQLLIDHARYRNAVRRGGDAVKLPLAEQAARCEPRDADLVALDDALGRLQAMDPRQYRVVVLKSFAGLTIEEIAEELELGPTTVKKEWRIARAWLRRELSGAGIGA